ncbi:MAG: heme-copper oxidase subunit III [Cytophagales bacterium]|nr:MAG: heme-copper oxidase subunit III [Cytophagales bacterium]
MLWLAIVGMALVFFCITFIYTVLRLQVQWLAIELPKIFWLSTLFILLSSYTLHLSNWSLRTEKFTLHRIMLALTLFLGIIFIVFQLLGWQSLNQDGIRLRGHPAGSFIYVLSGLHILHVLIGILFIGIVFIRVVQNSHYIDSFVYSVNPPNQLRMKLITIYWHFVDILWVYLFLFLLFNHS